MAIPFNLPSDECTIEQYRNIHQLLLDLINLLRALLNSETPPSPSPSPNSPPPAYGTYFGFPTPPSSVPSSPSPFSPGAASTTAFVLPDVVASAMPTNELRNFWNSQQQQQQQQQMMSNLIHTSETESQRITETMTRSATPSLSGNKLRKRKRARLTKKTKLPKCQAGGGVDSQCNCVASSKCYLNSTQCERNHKIPITTGTPCSCACPATANADQRASHNVHHHHRRDDCCNLTDDVPMRNTEYYVDPSMFRRTAAAANNDCKSPPSWTYIGEELRRMTDGLQNTETSRKEQKITAEDISETKNNGIISQCGRTVFAAALLVLGWKLLKQN